MTASYAYGFLGGLCIGMAAVLLFVFNGRIMGVSGIVSGALARPSKDSWWRFAFITGLVLGGWVYQWKYPVEVFINASLGELVVAGILVGFGTVIGGGCTSGHGICGIARLSRRSMAATAIFIAAGVLTVLLKKIGGN